MAATHEIKSETPMGILFVDDEKNVLQALRRLFMDDDYEVNLANSGEEALEILKHNPDIGLIISDQRMPGLTGVDFLEKAKEILPDAIRILLTGYADLTAVVDAINRGGAYRYITKPWKDDELVQVIEEAAGRYSLLKENKRLQKIVEKQNDELTKWNSQLEYFVQEQTLEIQNKNKELESLNRNLKDNFKNSIAAFSGLIELRDEGTANHSKNVAEISIKAATTMGLSGAELEGITIAALLHDIGKIGIPDVLFLKEMDEMDEFDRKEYMKHPVRGQAAIDSVENLRKAGVLIRHHHEWFNGTGFPDKLRGEAIPIGSRIIAAADFFERAIRKVDADNAMEIALTRIKDDRGARFDPMIYPHLEAAVTAIFSKINIKTGTVEMELNVKDIKHGMVIARDVKSGTGITLLTKGTLLNAKNIQAIRRYYELDPSKSGIFVSITR